MGTEVKSAIINLLDQTWQAIDGQKDKVTGQTIVVPTKEESATIIRESRFAKEFPVHKFLERALKLAKEHGHSDIANLFGNIANDLRWSQNPQYTEANTPRTLLDGYAYAALSGPEGPIHLAAPRGGYALFGPDVTYPQHKHAPREIYLVLTPGAKWQLDGGEWFDVEPGDLIYHAPWQVHAMKTTTEPMLAFAGWIDSGDRLAVAWD